MQRHSRCRILYGVRTLLSRSQMKPALKLTGDVEEDRIAFHAVLDLDLVRPFQAEVDLGFALYCAGVRPAASTAAPARTNRLNMLHLVDPMRRRRPQEVSAKTVAVTRSLQPVLVSCDQNTNQPGGRGWFASTSSDQFVNLDLLLPSLGACRAQGAELHILVAAFLDRSARQDRRAELLVHALEP